MDPITHSLAGLALAGFSGQGFSILNPIYLGSLLGSLAPDLDIVLQVKGHMAYLRHHRGPTHSLPGLVITSLVMSTVLGSLFPGYSWSTVFFWILAGALSHTLLDVLNSYGARALWPFTNRNYSLNLLTLFDPVLVAVLGLQIMANTRSMYYSLGALALCFLYLTSRWVMIWRVRRFLRYHFRHRGIEGIIVFPAVMSMWNWSFLVETTSNYILGEVRCFSLALRIWHRLAKPGRNPLVKRALESKLGRLFADFTPLFHVSCTREEQRDIVRFLDLRYYVRERFLHSATLVFDEEQQPLEGLFHPYNRKRKIKIAI